MPAHQGLALFLLGSPSVELDGRLVEFRLYRALALLIYLAVSACLVEALNRIEAAVKKL